MPMHARGSPGCHTGVHAVYNIVIKNLYKTAYCDTCENATVSHAAKSHCDEFSLVGFIVSVLCHSFDSTIECNDQIQNDHPIEDWLSPR